MTEITKRKSIHDELRKYDYLAKDHSFVEVTEWSNGEGYDITFDDKVISLTCGQIDAILFLTLSLQYNR